MNRTQPESSRFVPELDAVRGIAILLVLLSHSEAILPVPDGVPYRQAVSDALYLGWIGVDLFFVLSGFLITGILADSLHAANYFSGFYARRALRILPLYVVMVSGYFHVLVPAARHWGRLTASVEGQEAWFWLHLANWPIGRGENTNTLLHFWSLAIEEQYYLVWPLLVYFAGRRWLPHLCGAVIVTAVALRFHFAGPAYGQWFLYALTPFRMDALAMGSLAAALVRHGPARDRLRQPWILGMLGVAAVTTLGGVLLTGGGRNFGRAPMATYGYTAIAAAAAALVLHAYLYAGTSAPLSRALRSSALRSLGRYSYAMYIFHVVAFVLFGHVCRLLKPSVPATAQVLYWLGAIAAGVALCYGLARVSWLLIEGRALAYKSRFGPR